MPHREEWEKAGMVPREIYKKCGDQGFLCPSLDEKYGGGRRGFLLLGRDRRGNHARVGESGFAINLHSDIVVPYINSFGNEEQKMKWLPGCVTGERVTAASR